MEKNDKSITSNVTSNVTSNDRTDDGNHVDGNHVDEHEDEHEDEHDEAVTIVEKPKRTMSEKQLENLKRARELAKIKLNLKKKETIESKKKMMALLPYYRDIPMHSTTTRL